MKTKLFNFLLIVTALTACGKIDCFDNSGPVVKMNRAAAPFHQVDVYDNVNVFLTQDTAEAIVVEAGKHLQPNIITNISNGVLTVQNTTTCNWLRSPDAVINVYVSLKNIDRINYNGSGGVTSTNTLVADTIMLFSKDGAGNVVLTLDAHHTTTQIQDENADFILHGRSYSHYAYCNSRGSINFSDFAVHYLNLGYAGTMPTTVNVIDRLDATLYHTGSVYYKGNTAIVSSQYYGSGRLFKLP